MSKILVYGSGECDQLGLQECPPFRKRGAFLEFFDNSDIVVKDIKCGGLHSLILAENGKVYSWGCNDEGALGRDGTSEEPGLVELPWPATGIAAGDSHSIAYSCETNEVYWWGLY